VRAGAGAGAGARGRVNANATARSAPDARGRPIAERIGSAVEQLAVLVGAGVTPQHAWAYVAEGSLDPVVIDTVARIDRGVPIADAIGASAGVRLRQEKPLSAPALASAGARARAAGGRRGEGGEAAKQIWRVLAAAWFVATEAGAPLGRCLSDIADSLCAVGQVEREVEAALSGPAATTRLVTALPAVSVVSGWVLGLDTIAVLVGSFAGITCLVAGLVLMVLGRAWSSLLVRRARRVDPAPGITLDLMAVAVAGGGSLTRATALVDLALDRFGLDRGADAESIRSVLTLASRAGAPPADLLRSEAQRVRRDSVGAASRGAAALGVWLMLPLGVCVLPAFMLLAVAPVVIGVLASTAWA
jgi:tight adherence protein B